MARAGAGSTGSCLEFFFDAGPDLGPVLVETGSGFSTGVGKLRRFRGPISVSDLRAPMLDDSDLRDLASRTGSERFFRLSGAKFFMASAPRRFLSSLFSLRQVQVLKVDRFLPEIWILELVVPLQVLELQRSLPEVSLVALKESEASFLLMTPVNKN